MKVYIVELEIMGEDEYETHNTICAVNIEIARREMHTMISQNASYGPFIVDKTDMCAISEDNSVRILIYEMDVIDK